MNSYPCLKLLGFHPAILCKPKIKLLRESNAVFLVKLYPSKNTTERITIPLGHKHTLQGCNGCLTTTCYLKIMSAVFITQNFYGRTCLQWKARLVTVRNLVCCYIIFYFKLLKLIKPCINKFHSTCHCMNLL